ncbi:uncharacterized protein LOC142588192 [Dermacentor variabilis]|uniref:uncharacterized protein LOC142588192 n=1 Tax=Dermacentor variabilis TaxID=34621 RepID=UPI003F5B48BD
MPRPCDVAGCPNGPRNGPGRLAKSSCSGESNVTYHSVPRSEPLRSKWLSAVPLRQWDGKKPKNFVVCSLHFRPEDYECNGNVSKSCGVPFRALLSRRAVPSVVPEIQEPLQDDKAAAELAEMETSDSMTDTSNQSDVTEATRDVGTQASLSSSTAGKSGSSFRYAKYAQVRLRGTSIGVQVNTTMKKTKEKGTQVL